MKTSLARSTSTVTWLLIIPTLAWYYVGLFATMALWYPAGLSTSAWQEHLIHFSIIYLLWLTVFFSYHLFDWDALRTTQAFLGRLVAALLICLVIAVIYFYFQPALLLTPRRFLLVHVFITGVGITLWYTVMRAAASRASRRHVFIHHSIAESGQVEYLLNHNKFRGLQYAGKLNDFPSENLPGRSVVIVASGAGLSPEESRLLFDLRNHGVQFVEYHQLYEDLTRTVHLSVLTDMWFIHSIDYSAHQLFDIAKRGIDILLGLLSIVIFLATYPIIGLLVKISSSGPVFFKQQRISQNGKIFTLYKYRTMTMGGANDTWTAPKDSRITRIGKALRVLRLDELPQSLNILKGEMSIVGPRPEQVNIVKELSEQIPYYNERHIVKPGLTGWAQLHVYAGNLEETKRKLQYDLYYIKHRSLLFDLEIILKTVYNIITFAGR